MLRAAGAGAGAAVNRAADNAADEADNAYKATKKSLKQGTNFASKAISGNFQKALMPDLMRRLDVVYKNCGGGQDQQLEDQGEGLDDFQKQKVSLANKIITIREEIKERDEAAEGGNRSDNKNQIIKLSQQIRKDIAETKEEYQTLLKIHEKLSKKKPKKKDADEFENIMAQRRQQIEVINDHIKEVEKLDKRRFAKKIAERSNDGGSSDGPSGSRASRKGSKSDASADRSSRNFDDLPIDPLETNLPEIDISDVLKQVKSKDELIDQGLDEMSKRVAKLHSLALSMNDELKKQEQITAEVEKQIDKVTDKVQTLNTKLIDTMEKIGGQRRFIAVIFLLVILVALIGLTYLSIQTFLKKYVFG